MVAVEKGWLEVVKLLIDNKVNLNAKNVWNETASRIAIRLGHLNILNY